jgi:hypothetical protein
VVSEDFLDAVENGSNPIQAITLNLIANWGGDVEKRFLNLNVSEKVKTAFKSGMSCGSSGSYGSGNYILY